MGSDVKRSGIEMMLAERVQQMRKGYTLEHDLEEHGAGSNDLLNDALTLVGDVFGNDEDPGAMVSCKYPTGASPVRKLVIAGALLAAHVDMLLAEEEAAEHG